MKRLLVILFLAFSYASIAQNESMVTDNQNNVTTDSATIQKVTPKLGADNLYSEYETTSMQLAKTNYYLDKYASQALAGDLLIIGGSVLTSCAAFFTDYDTASFCAIMGIGVGVAGYIMKLSAYNNLRSYRLKYDGFKVTYTL